MERHLEFEEILNEFITNEKYMKLKDETHHGVTRYDHSIRVAKIAYKIATNLNLDYVSVTRASLLHDFFLNEELGEEKLFNQTKNHARIALDNSLEYFELNDKEQNAILAHMFPFNMVVPKSLEGIVLKFADIGAAIYERTKYSMESIVGVLNPLLNALLSIVYKTQRLFSLNTVSARELNAQKEYVLNSQTDLTNKFIHKIPFLDTNLKEKCIEKINLVIDDIVDFVFDDSKIKIEILTTCNQELNNQKSYSLVKKAN